MECEKLAQEKTEMQRHYVMVSFSYLFIFTAQTPKKITTFYLRLLFASFNLYLSTAGALHETDNNLSCHKKIEGEKGWL